MNLNGTVLAGKCFNFVIVLVIYIAIVFIYKYLFARLLLSVFDIYRKVSLREVFCKNLWCFLFAILSPDYALTKIVKLRFNIDIFKKEKLIKSYNFINLLISAVLFTILLFVNVCIYFYMLVLIRLISRAVEIIISFALDVVSYDKSSSLKTSNRMILAAVSFIEYYLLIISIFAINQGKLINLSLINSFFGNLFNIFSCNCFGKDVLEDILPIAATIIFNAIMFTFVICNYVNNKKSNKIYFLYNCKTKKVECVKLNYSLNDLRKLIENNLNKKRSQHSFFRFFKCNCDIYDCDKKLYNKLLLPNFLVMYQNAKVGYVYSVPFTSAFDIENIKKKINNN